MCLYIRDKKPRVAKRDIVVLKYLTQRGYGKNFFSPYMGTEVTLGKVLVASPSESPYSRYHTTDYFGRKISAIGIGAIHAKLFENRKYSNYCAKAIIPKGTKYWVDPFGTEIAAEKMLITKETGDNDVLGDSFAREILASAPKINGIRIGDYQMTDDSFVHPKKSIAKTKVRGIVCGFYKNGEPIICALEKFSEAWSNKYDDSIGEYIRLRAVIRSFNGRKVTRKYIQKEYEDKSRFSAFERCINYRKDKGEEWFFGAIGETMTMLDNAIYLNAAYTITGLGFIIHVGYQYWSCSEYSLFTSMYCSLNNHQVYFDSGRKYYPLSVVPFYASTNGVSKKK